MRDVGLTQIPYMRREADDLFDFLAVSPDFNEQRALPSAQFIDPFVASCTTDHCPGTRNGELLYIDKGHLSVRGSVWLMQAIAAQFHEGPISQRGR